MSVNEQIEIGDLVYDLNEETKTALIVGCLDYVSNDPFTVSIPNTVAFDGQNYTVTGIGYEGFYDCTYMEGITIPDSITEIGMEAFEDCTCLKSVIIPNSVTSIGWGAFYGCSSLKSITIPDSVTSIGDHAFYDCDNLKSITLPDGLTEFNEGLLDGCDNLTEIAIPCTDKAFPLWVHLMGSKYADLVKLV